MKISAWRNRLSIDTSDRDGITEVLGGGSPFFWNASCVQFELGLFRKGTIIDDLSNLKSITIEIKPTGDITGSALMSGTVAAASFNTSLTLALWQTGLEDNCHAKIEFTASQANLDLGGAASITAWLVISAERADGQTIILGCTYITIAEDGRTGAGTGSGSDHWRANAGYPELQYPDLSWHAITPLVKDGQYTFDVEQTSSAAASDQDNSKFRFNEGYLELQYADSSWHRMTPLVVEGQYVVDIDPTPSATFTFNSDHFRTYGGYPEFKFSDDSWHRLAAIITSNGYTFDITQNAS